MSTDPTLPNRRTRVRRVAVAAGAAVMGTLIGIAAWASAATDCASSSVTTTTGTYNGVYAASTACGGSEDEAWLDEDGDGYGDTASGYCCFPTTGSTTGHSITGDWKFVPGDGDGSTNQLTSDTLEDCNDTNDATGVATFPGSAGTESSTDCMTDLDGDGYGDDSPGSGVTAGTDCDDDNDTTGQNTYPGAAANDSSTDCMTDVDGDGYGDDSAPGGVTDGTDCDDSEALVRPDIASNESDPTDCMADVDGDGWGDSDATTTYTSASSNLVDGDDCDDSLSTVNPTVTEVCDGIDNDCDSSIDEGVGTTFYADDDEDGFGNASSSTTECSNPTVDCTDGLTGTACYVTVAGDCLDTDANTYRGAASLESSSACMTDADADGYGDDSPVSGVTAGSDCDDSAGAVFPGATEVCDTVDNDCDGSIDEGVGQTWYIDSDSDGQGSTATTSSACSQPTGYVANANDCLDTDANTFRGAANNESSTACMTDADNDGYGDDSPVSGVTAGTDCDDSTSGTNPAATEVCDTLDNDCDGSVDEGVVQTWYLDSDGDGQGTSATTSSACTQPSGYVANANDCLDTDANTFRGSASAESATACMTDADNDGYGDDSPVSGVTAGTDCDDTSLATNPAATETCNGVDDDCDGTIDDGVGTTFYQDADGDGQGTSTATQTACTATVSGYVLTSGDCDDTDAFTYRGVANNDSATSCMRDLDGDGFGDDSPTNSAVAAGTDCDDSSTGGSNYPGATEVCDSADNDCDGNIDEGVRFTYYLDGDGDDYGLTASTITACSTPSGYADASGDCDDTDSNTYPGSAERQSSTTCMTDADNDGYGDLTPASGVTAGSDCDDAVATTFRGTAQFDSSTACMADADNDGYGDTSAPTGGTAGTDCDDATSSTNPGASETCNGVDDDCDGTVDDGVLFNWYQDTDGDTYGNPSVSTQSCTQPTGYVRSQTDCDDSDGNTFPGSASSDSASACMTDDDGDGYGDLNPAGGVTAGTDCDDTDSSTNPGATEACDGVDNDCNSVIDDGATSNFYRDTDGDLYGNPSSRVTACSAPSGYVTDNTDCDDADASTRPGIATNETSSAACMTDADGDGYGDDTPSAATATSGTDCNDANANVSPGDVEVCDSANVDEDCDGLADDNDPSVTNTTTWYLDSDGDSYGTSATTLVQCEQPTSYVTVAGDCDDSTAAANPGATEACDTIDNDCDGSIDEGLTNNTWYLDIDEDGYGAAASGSSVAQCSNPTSSGACTDGSVTTDCYRTNDLDCDDNDDAINPAAQEICDSVDNDCDGQIDDNDASVDNTVATGGGSYFYPDNDSDGYGQDNTSARVEQCNAPSNYVRVPLVTASDANNDGLRDFDCNDSNSAINPAEIEICDASDVDEDCDGLSDDADTTVDQGTYATWYIDVDEDAYGTSSTGSGTLVYACNNPSATNGCIDGITSTDCYRSTNTDCDDADAAINPAATEICNSIDDDCDNLIDANDGSLSGGTTFYRDADSDSYGDAGDSSTECATSRSGYVLNATDCDDTDLNTYPGATEVCDGARNNCNQISSGIPTNEIDLDNDGYVACGFDGTVTWQGTGTINVGEDCAPTDNTTYPNATEVCDGVYNDCNGRGGATSAPANETDNDADGYVECYDGTTTWDVAATLPFNGRDCDDNDATVYPTASELCDGQFNNCNDTQYGTTAAPDDERDDDADTYVECSGYSATTWVGDSTVVGGDDCNGSDELVFPNAQEQCDGRFNDCSDPLRSVQSAPDTELDVDSDRYVECNYNSGTWQGLSSILGGNDCDDQDRSVFPSAPERCDGQFNDCDDPAYDSASQPDDEFDDDGDYFIECTRFSSIAWNPSDTALADPLLKCPLANPNCSDCDDTDSATHPPYRPGFGLSPNSYYEAGDLAYACLTDADGDGFGSNGPADGVTVGTDCDDTLATVYPEAPENCEADVQVDNDCDGSPNTYQGDPVTSEADGAITAYLDEDGDGYGTGASYVVCELGDGFSSSGGDCADTDPSKYPGATEVCNEQDDDCDDEADEAEDLDPLVSGCVDMYRDSDGDGYGDYDLSLCLCLTGEDAEGTEYRDDRYVTIGGDCDDFSSDTRPLTCADGRDNDGDGTTDGNDPDCQAGLDESGVTVEQAVEYIDGHDNDCDGQVPVIEMDCDDDGSLPLLPIQLATTSSARDVGLANCTGPGTTRLIECWGDAEVQVVCDLQTNPYEDPTDPTDDIVGTGLWMLRLDSSDDNWGERYDGGRRIYDTRICESVGDCDDQCPSRCPDLDEACDGLDNDCSASSIPVEDESGDGLPASMVSQEAVAGTVSVDELDADQDGFLACGTFSALELQVHTTDAACESAIIDEALGTDCNNLCVLTNPAATERCNGFLDVCLGEPEGADLDFDDMRTCGAWSAPGSDEMPEDVLMVAWVQADEAADSGTPTPDSGTTDDSATPADTAADSGDSGSTAVSAGTGSLVPLVLPRSFEFVGSKDPKDPWPAESSVAGVPTLNCGQYGISGNREVYACDETLYNSLFELVGEDALHRSICEQSATRLVAACNDGSGTCGLVNIELSSSADEEVWDGYFSDCEDNEPQLITRAMWPRERIVQAREAVVEQECYRMFGLPCDRITGDVPVRADWTSMVDVTDALRRAQWKELDRYDAEAFTDGTVAWCWGDPTEGVEDINQETGGDCSDTDNLSHRDLAEGPGDLLGQLDPNGGADCTTCLDGLDNNCDGFIDCEDPACAACFVGQGSGCSSDSPCAGGGCAVASASDRKSRRAALVVALWLVAVLARRREGR